MSDEKGVAAVCSSASEFSRCKYARSVSDDAVVDEVAVRLACGLIELVLDPLELATVLLSNDVSSVG